MVKYELLHIKQPPFFFFFLNKYDLSLISVLSHDMYRYPLLIRACAVSHGFGWNLPQRFGQFSKSKPQTINIL